MDCKPFVILVDVYNTAVCFLFSWEDINKRVLKRVLKDWDLPFGLIADVVDTFSANTTGKGALTYAADSSLIFVGFNSVLEGADFWEALQHEIFHAADYILRNRGIVINDGSHEAYAYLIGYLSRKAYIKLT